MQAGTIDVDSLAGGFDLQSTVESGQSYLWWRADGRDYETDPYGGDGWYLTTTRSPEPAVVRVRQRDGRLEWESTVDAESVLRRRLRLEDDLPAIRDATSDDDLVEAAYE
ncbi:MAG: N-glycosylase/DNA lyase, partial [Haloarculaceae archaeon]